MRAFRVIEMFNNGLVTARMIVDEFDVGRGTANNWINAASLVLPVYESGSYDSGGAPGKVFELLKKEVL